MKKFFLLIMFTISLFSDVTDIFKDEINKPDFKINAYAKFDFMGGFADGKYKLKEYDIKYIKNNIYQLNLVFYKKKGVFRYIQKLKLYFYYKYPVVIFAYKNKKVKVNLTPKIKIEKVKNGYEIKKILNKQIKIPIDNGVLYLFLSI